MERAIHVLVRSTRGLLIRQEEAQRVHHMNSLLDHGANASSGSDSGYDIITPIGDVLIINGVCPYNHCYLDLSQIFFLFAWLGKKNTWSPILKIEINNRGVL